MKMHNAKRYISVLLLLISFSCSFEEREGPEPPADEYIDAVIHISSSSSASPSTYALTEPDGEEMIKEIDVLAFKESGSDEYYAYRTRTTKINVNNGQKEFTISVKLSKNNEKYRFVIVANASAAVNNANFTTNATREQVYALILSDLSGNTRWDATELSPGIPNKPIPMWGETGTQVVTDNMTLSPIRMLRALARVDVGVEQAVQSKFRLTDIYVYNSKTKGRIIPDINKVQSDGNVKEASVPVGTNLTRDSIHYASSSATEYKREIYLYETDAVKENGALQATCLVIGGYYDVPSGATQKSYYRVDFFVDKKNDLSFKPILRNHCYNIKITDVLSEGFKTPDEAFENIKTNMTVIIESWIMDGSDYHGNPYNFVINRNEFKIGPGSFTGSFILTTEYPKGWTSSTGGSSGITLNPASGTTAVTNQKIDFEVEATATTPITISVTSGPITKKIVITR
jgi:hypothetical protein